MKIESEVKLYDNSLTCIAYDGRSLSVKYKIKKSVLLTYIFIVFTMFHEMKLTFKNSCASSVLSGGQIEKARYKCGEGSMGENRSFMAWLGIWSVLPIVVRRESLEIKIF